MVKLTQTLQDLSGIHAVLYALFDKNEKIDFHAMRAQAQLMIDAKVHGITVLGLATEVQKLSVSERLEVIRIIAQEIVGRVPFSVTVSGNSVAEQREVATHAINHGANCLILQPPSVGSFSGSAYIDFFLRVTDGLESRFAIQNAPEYLGHSLSNTDIFKLRSANEGFSVIKTECSSIELAQFINSAGPDLTVLNGRGGLEMTDCLQVGASGFILAPDILDHAQNVYRLWGSGEKQAATEAHAHALPAIIFVMQSIEHLTCYGKRLFGLRANFKIYDRGPCLQPTKIGAELTKNWAQWLGRFGVDSVLMDQF